MVEKYIPVGASPSSVAIGVIIGAVMGFWSGSSFIETLAITGDFSQGFVIVAWMVMGSLVAIAVLAAVRGEWPSSNASLDEGGRDG